MAVNWKKDKSKQFVNPYNFVQNKGNTTTKRKESGSLSGRIDCVIKTKEAICLPDRDSVLNNTERCYDFYNIAGQYLIPGSTIRGCIRSVFETVTNSCYLTTADSELTVRMKKPRNTTAGILKYENEQWVLYSAKYKDSPQGPSYTKDTHGTIERKWRILFAKNGQNINKSFWFKQGNKENSISGEALSQNVKKLEYILELYKENNNTAIDHARGNEKADLQTFGKTIDSQLRAIKEKNPEKPVFIFYEIKNGRFEYLSPAAIGRYAFKNSVHDLLGNDKPCSGKEGKFCPACRLFGTVTDKNENLASSLRFGDALPTNNDCIREKPVLLNEMSSPKISSMEFYSFLLSKLNIKENVACWGYDTENVSLRGRKYYFHSKAVPSPDSAMTENVVPERQLATRPSKAGSEFRFSIWFDNIDEDQLSQLCWAITLGENDEKGKYMHKIGTARPFGYGSAKITIESLVCRSFDVQSSAYSVKNKSNNEINEVIEAAKLDDTAKAELRIITNYDFLNGKNVHYPIADSGNGKNHDAGFQWFMANRTNDNKFKQILPKLSENPDDMVMDGYSADNSNSGGYNNGKGYNGGGNKNWNGGNKSGYGNRNNNHGNGGYRNNSDNRNNGNKGNNSNNGNKGNNGGSGFWTL